MTITEIFCFGSNLAGRHGLGAAKWAHDRYDAVYGVGRGRTGFAYAIPTKDEKIKTLPLSRIEPFVKEFIQYTIEHPELTFILTRIGCGLAGYTDKEMAPLFKGISNNVKVPVEWEFYLKGD
jgi:hypothetical protein